MPRNGSGVYSVYTPGNPVVAGTTIDPTAFNNTTNDLATALTNSIASNGETPVTANLPMAGFKHTGAGAATASGQYLTYGQAGNFTNIVAAGTVTGVTDLTTTGNTILGDAATDTLNVGAGGIIKDASGNVGIGVTPTQRLDVSGTAVRFTNGTYTTFFGGTTLVAGSGANDSAIRWDGTAGALRFSYQGAGSVLSIGSTGDLTGLGIAISRSKSASTSRSSTTTLADDPDLIVPLSAGRWEYEIFLPVRAVTSGAGGFKCAVAFGGTAPAFYQGALSYVSGALAGAALNVTPGTSVATFAALSTGVADWIKVVGSLTVTAAGNLSLQWAQNSSNANTTVVDAAASVSCTKVG